MGEFVGLSGKVNYNAVRFHTSKLSLVGYMSPNLSTILSFDNKYRHTDDLNTKGALNGSILGIFETSPCSFVGRIHDLRRGGHWFDPLLDQFL